MYSKKLHTFWCYLSVTLGTFLLAFGAVIFLSKLELVSGGISGIAIIVQHFVKTVYVYDYVVAALMIIFWVLGLIFLGLSFSLKTLYSTLLYIGFTFLFARVPFFDTLASHFAGYSGGSTPEVGNYILCGVFGGVFVGGGVALTFLGGGSSGGVDVAQLILKKYWGLRESISSFTLDAFVIIVGMCTMCVTDPQYLVPALCGILSCFVTAMLIELVYIKSLTSFQVDIISDHWQEISQYAQDVLGRGATIIRAEGGYKGEERIILRIVFDRSQYDSLKGYIAKTDPKAFVTFTQTNAVYGEGFELHKKSNKDKK